MGNVVILHPSLMRARDMGIYNRNIGRQAKYWVAALGLYQGAELRLAFDKAHREHGIWAAVSRLTKRTENTIKWHSDPDRRGTGIVNGTIYYSDTYDASDEYRVLVDVITAILSLPESQVPRPRWGYIARAVAAELGFKREWVARSKRVAPLWPPAAANDNSKPSKPVLRVVG